MTVRSNLKLVEATSFEVREGALWSEDGQEAHSLHGVLSLPDSTAPETASFFLREYSKKGDIVLDPFCGTGAVGVEANLLGRIAYVSDVQPLSVCIAKAKLDPADITEVTLKLQLCNVRRPISTASFTGEFRPFFDIDTFREIVNVRNYLRSQDDSASRFVEALTSDLLHGPTAGYFSVYTSPTASLTPEEQEALNRRRSQTPDYRSVIPRVLRKAAMVLRDGLPSTVRDMRRRNRAAVADSRDLSWVNTASVDLTLCTPPYPGQVSALNRRWLTEWFYGVRVLSPDRHSSHVGEGLSVQEWLEFMNGSLLEIARVSRSGARAVINLREIVAGRETVRLDEVLKEDVREHLYKYWDVEGLFVNVSKGVKIRHKERDASSEQRSRRVLVLRRR